MIPNAYPASPGRLYAGEYPGSASHPPAADATTKLESLLDAGIAAFIDLTEPRELVPYAESVATIASARGMSVVHERHSIPDGHTCSVVATMRDILDAIDAHLAAERAVYVHCLGGIGRTGMTIGCWLVRHGASPETALARVAAGFDSMPKRAHMRSWTSPETPAQMQVVRDWLPNT